MRIGEMCETVEACAFWKTEGLTSERSIYKGLMLRWKTFYSRFVSGAEIGPSYTKVQLSIYLGMLIRATVVGKYDQKLGP
jgi:hypothetical protein